MKNVADILKNTSESLNSRIYQAEERISELEERLFENTEEKKEKRKNSLEACLQGLEKASKGQIKELLALKKGRERRVESLFKKVVTENFLNQEKGINIQVQEGYTTNTKQL